MSDTLPSVRRALARFAKKIPRARVSIRLFADERKSLEERARSANKTLSSYLRDCALAPIERQSPAIPSSNSEDFESLRNENVREDEQTFVHEAIEAKKNSSKFSKQAGSETGGRDLASERTGHVKGCACFACERLRGMIGSSTTIGSGENRENKGKTPKSKRINAL